MDVNAAIEKLFDYYNVYTITELAEKIGVQQPVVSGWRSRNSINAVKKKCRELGIDRALVTCDNNNLGSARTIIKNGGILENEVPQKDGSVTQRYWITISSISGM